MIGDSVRLPEEPRARRSSTTPSTSSTAIRADPEYALRAVKAAAEAGADWVVLCDTNGGSLPSWVREVVRAVQAAHPRARPSASTPTTTASWRWPTRWPRWRRAAPRCRARSTATASAAATPTWSRSSRPSSSRWAMRCVTEESLRPPHRAVAHGLRDRQHATRSPRRLRRRLRLRPQGRRARGRGREGGGELRAHPARAGGQPAQGGGLRAVRPGQRAPARGRDGPGRAWARSRRVLARIKELENRGYQFEAAEGSFELLVRRSRPGYVPPFEILDLVVIAERRARARRDVRGGHGQAARSGTGSSTRWPRATAPSTPSTARCARRSSRSTRACATSAWPTTRSASSIPKSATGAKTRVLIEAARDEERWSTIGVSQNIIEASGEALADSLELHLLRVRDRDARAQGLVAAPLAGPASV